MLNYFCYFSLVRNNFWLNIQTIDIEIELTANHRGHFELSLCPNNNARIEANQRCFDKFPLKLENGDDNKYFIPADAGIRGIFKYRVELPAYVTCTQCVLQWTYYTGNMWGLCPNGTESLACGRPGSLIISIYFWM